MDELEAKVRIFEAITNNNRSLCDNYSNYTPQQIAEATNKIYKKLTEK